MANGLSHGVHGNVQRPAAFLRFIKAVFVVVAVSAMGQTAFYRDSVSQTDELGGGQRSQLTARDLPLIALASEVMPISIDEAISRNKLRPVEAKGFIAARPFIIDRAAHSDPHYTAALQCLTQAVYYEAGYEPPSGMRAVAQVILNRVRHPAFPNSVCGVVYQGSERTTGCQFTFTCDGSLQRVPSTDAWRRSRLVAIAALNGWVEPTVGLATNYHADYVLPYWASSLTKMATIGRHIFYGKATFSRAVFSQPYAFGLERIPAMMPIGLETDIPLDFATEALPTESIVIPIEKVDPLANQGKLKVEPVDSIPERRSSLEADRTKGELIIGSSKPKLLRD